MTKNHLKLRDLRRSDQPEGRFDLIRSPVRIGRGPRCEIRLYSDDIADVQAILRRDGDCWKIHPVGPGKDCQVNQKPLVDAVNLTAGSRFTIGHVQFELADPDSIFSQLSTLVQPVRDKQPEPDSQSTFEKASSTPIAIQTIPEKPVVSEINAIPQQPVVSEIIAIPEQHVVEESVPNIEIEMKSVELPAERAKIQKPAAHSKIEIETPITNAPLGSFLQKVTQSLRHSDKPASSALLNDNWSSAHQTEMPVQAVNQTHKTGPVAKNTSRAIVDDSFSLFADATQPSTTTHSKPVLNSNSQAPSLPKSLSAWADDFSRRYRSSIVPAGQSLTPTISNDLDQSLFQTSSTIPVVSKESSPRIWDESLFEIPAASVAPVAGVSNSDGIAENITPHVDEIQLVEPELESCAPADEPVACESHIEPESFAPAVEQLTIQSHIEPESSEPESGCNCVDDPEIKSESVEKPVLVIQNLSAFVQILPEILPAETLSSDFDSISHELQFSQPDADSVDNSNELSITDAPASELQSFDAINDAAHDGDSLGLSEVLDSEFSLPPAIESIPPVADDHTPHAPHLLQQREAHVDFEDWLANVGSILEDVESVEQKLDVIPDAEPEQDAVLPDVQLESESVEIIIDPENNRISSADPGVRSIALSIEKSDKVASAERIQEKVLEQSNDSLSSDPESFDNLNAHSTGQNQDRNESDEQQWPSVGDILKWSATRSGVPPFQQNSNNEIQNTEPESLEPGQFLRMNLPIALICSSILTFGTIGLAGIAWKMSAQDNLSQITISSVLGASQSGQPPRLSTPMMESLTQPRSWWQITADQIWWRATFVKMREVNGLPMNESSQVLAERALENNPVHSPARLWKAIASVSENDHHLWSGLSRDVISLTLSADHFRRIGDDDRATQADKEALELATSPEQLFRLQKVVFDSELGTERFLLPGQTQSVAILKRLVKEPDPVKSILAVMPENKPVVWLTAAQLIRQNGLGDYSELVKRVLEASPDQPLNGMMSQRLSLAVRAEALAMNHEMDQAIEVYRRLAQQSPPSDWTRSWYFNLGALNNQIQKPEDALVFWRKARGDDPNHQVDRHAIQATRSFASSSAVPAISNASTTIRAN